LSTGVWLPTDLYNDSYKGLFLSTLSNKKYFPVLCWGTVALIYVFTYGLLVIPESIVPELKKTFNTDLSGVGFYSASFLYAWIAMQIPAGIMFDHYNSRKLIFCSALILVIGCFIQGVTTDLEWGIFSRILMGGASSYALVGAIYLARSWFSVVTLPIMIGLTEGVTGFAEIGFPVVFTDHSIAHHWRSAIFIIGIVLLIIAFGCLFLVEDQSRAKQFKKERDFNINFGVVFKNKYMWGLGLFVGFAMAYYLIMINMWGVVWLKKQFGIHTSQAVYLDSTAIFGFMVGAPVIGWVSRFMPRRILLMICMLFEYGFLVAMNFSATTIESHSIVLGLLGFFTGGVILAFDMVKEIIGESHYGLAIGFLNIFFALVGVILTPLMGYILMLHTGKIIYKPLLLQITAVIAAILSIFIAWRFKFDKTQEYEID
jgi:MFS family permease